MPGPMWPRNPPKKKPMPKWKGYLIIAVVMVIGIVAVVAYEILIGWG